MIRRSARYGMIGGVCAGYAISERVPTALVRIFAVLLFLLSGGTAIIAYLVLWMMMPAGTTGPANWEQPVADAKFCRTQSNRMIGGVCGALSRYFNTDATLIRVIVLLLAVLGGVGVVTYLIAWLVIPDCPYVSDADLTPGPAGDRAL